MKKNQSHMKEAQNKLNQILKKAKSLGVAAEDIHQVSKKLGLPEAKLPDPSYWKITLLTSVASLLLLGHTLDLQHAAYNVYLDWKEGSGTSKCAVSVPDSLNNLFRPPVHCNVCEDVQEVDRVAGITVEAFEDRYAYTGRPVVVTDATSNWTGTQTFSYDFFKSLYQDRIDKSLSQKCQFFPYKTDFKHLGEFLNLTRAQTHGSSPWYVGWSNCDMEITDTLRQHYQRPYFLPSNAESKRLDWVFMGSVGYGAPLHVDNVEYPSWQAQLKGIKKWRLEPPPECFYVCQAMEVTVEPGEIIVLDTNKWFHSTEIISEDISITIGAEYD